MRIVNREEFLKLPAGTLYQEFEPDILTGLHIKRDSIEHEGEFVDFFQTDLINISFTGSSGSEGDSKAFDEMVAGGSRHAAFNRGRDGLYDESQLYAVWEEHDVRQLHALLGELLPK